MERVALVLTVLVSATREDRLDELADADESG